MKLTGARAARVAVSFCLLATLAGCGSSIDIRENSFARSGLSKGDAGADPGSAWTDGPVTLSWTPPLTNTDGSTLGDLAGYKIYAGPSSDQLDLRVTLKNPGLARYTMDQLESDDAYFAISAFNSRGAEGPRSSVLYRYEG